MNKIEWTTYMETGDKEVDDYHREILDLINLLAEAITAHSSHRAVKNIVVNIYNYSLDHFKFEENAIAESSKDNIEDLKKEHQASLTELHNIMKVNLKKEGQDNYYESYDSVYNWFFNHILDEDQKYLQKIEKSKGYPPAA